MPECIGTSESLAACYTYLLVDMLSAVWLTRDNGARLREPFLRLSTNRTETLFLNKTNFNE